MSRPHSSEGAKARRAKRAKRRLRHFRSLAIAAAETKVLAHAAGVERLGELEEIPFERAAREVLAEHKAGRLTDADLLSLGIRETDDGVWIRVGPRWGHG